MDEVLTLVEAIFRPGNSSENINTAQRQLQKLQKSESGWELGKALLATNDPNAQFLGIQTFMVQLNEKSFLPVSTQIHEDLLKCLVDCISKGNALFVIRKLLSVISKVYLRSDDWQACPTQVLSILNGVNGLDMEFVMYLIEDSELTSQQLRQKLVPNVSSLVAPLFSEFSSVKRISSFTLWCSTFFDQFMDIVPSLINRIIQTNINADLEDEQEIKTCAVNSVKEIYSSNSKKWSFQLKTQLEQMLSTFATQYITSSGTPTGLVFDPENELNVSMCDLVLEICENNLEENVNLHPFIMLLSATPIPVVEDPLATSVLDFWNTYTEEVVSNGMDKSAVAVIAPLIQSYWPRIQIYDTLSLSDWNEFASFRRDFADFLELSYQIIGKSLFEHLTNVVLQNIGSSNCSWYEIESAMFCLNSLADIIGEDYKGDRPEFLNIRTIFQSQLWSRLPECQSMRVRQTAVNLIGSFVDFFQSPEGHQFLAITLNYLFTSLATPTLQNSASNSIKSLCCSSRQLLTNEIPIFLQVYAQVRTNLESLPHIRTVQGISMVIQAVKNLETQAQNANQLLDLVLENYQSQTEPISEKLLITKLGCIAAMGKSFQLPDNEHELLKNAEYTQFFSTESPSPLVAQFKSKLQTIILQSLESDDVMVIEAVCDILKSGIPETCGLFVFGTPFVIEYISTKAANGSAIIMSPLITLSRFLVLSEASLYKQSPSNSVLPMLITALINIILAKFDENASPCLDLLAQISQSLSKLSISMLTLPNFSDLLTKCALPSLSSSDRFILKSGCHFWKEFLNAEVITNDNEPVIELLVTSILKQISGQASRSDLNGIYDVIKVLLNKHQLLTIHQFEVQIMQPITPAIERQDFKQKQEFVSTLRLVKGSKKVEEVVLKFWLACRNIPSEYTPLKSY